MSSLDVMKPSFAEYILAYAASGFMLAMAFHGWLGLPSYFGSLFLIASMVCFFLFWRSWYRRAQTHPAELPPYTDTLNRWMVPLIAVAVVCAVVALFFEIFER